MKSGKKKSDKFLREYYEKHSALSSGKKPEPILMSLPKPRRLVALRLEEETLNALRRLAARKGLNYSTLMRMWITERLSQEKQE